VARLVRRHQLHRRRRPLPLRYLLRWLSFLLQLRCLRHRTLWARRSIHPCLLQRYCLQCRSRCQSFRLSAWCRCRS